MAEIIPATNVSVPQPIPLRKSRRRTLSSSASTRPTFASQYETDSALLGEGAYGSVFKCTHRITELDYAVKIIKKLGQSARKVNREIEVYHQCREAENILHLVELFEDENNFYLVFELIRGGSLEGRIADGPDDGRMEEQQVKSLMYSMASALDFLHKKGIAHRDVKPANILLPYPESIEGAKLCDFDLASRSKTDYRGDLCMSSPVGSAEFMAPEVVAAFTACDDERVRYDKSCDIWSLGVMAYSLLSGKPPFEGSCGKNCGWDDGASCDDCMELLFHAIQEGKLTFPEDRWQTISPDAKQIISTCLAKDPSRRPSPTQMLANPWFRDALGKKTKSTTTTDGLPNDVVVIA